MRKSLVVISLVILFYFTFGCYLIKPQYLNVFEGPPRPRNEVAYLTTQGTGLARFALIDGFTREEIRKRYEDEYKPDYFLGYSILPGEHIVVVLGNPAYGVEEETLAKRIIDSGVTSIWFSDVTRGISGGGGRCLESGR